MPQVHVFPACLNLRDNAFYLFGGKPSVALLELTNTPDVYTICGELSITPLLHRWALSFALQVRRCYLNIAPAQLWDKLVRPCHKHSTRGNNSSLYPFRSSSLSGTVSFTNRSPILWNALQSVSGSEISTFSQSRFKKSFLDLLLVYPKFISFTVGDINSCI